MTWVLEKLERCKAHGQRKEGQSRRRRISYRRRGVVKVVGAGGVGVGWRQRRDCHELGVGLRAAKVLLLGVVHRGGSARPQINEISNAEGAERFSEPNGLETRRCRAF